jgi:hypothetical protein
MKRIILLHLLLSAVSAGYGQYDKNKLMNIITSKVWSVKGVTTERPEKAFTFSKDMTVQTNRDDGKGGTISNKENWSLSTSDNIRWFINIAGQAYELIVSYAKDGTQYLKLSHKAAVNDSYEMNLFPLK